MVRIGLTGGSGSGKGYVTGLLEKRGYPCLDTDKLVHLLYKTDSRLISELTVLFGNDILDINGSVDRTELRKIVFADKKALHLLNKTVHKRVMDYCLLWLDEKESDGCLGAVIDAPQLFEAGMEQFFDFIVSVVCPVEIRVKRIMERDGLSVSDAELRISNQMSDEEYASKSHFVILNDGSLGMEERLSDILEKINLPSDDR